MLAARTFSFVRPRLIAKAYDRLRPSFVFFSLSSFSLSLALTDASPASFESPRPLTRLDLPLNCSGTNSISVWNNGQGIPITMHREENVYVPELIFGHLLTSSNYNDDEKKACACLGAPQFFPLSPVRTRTCVCIVCAPSTVACTHALHPFSDERGKRKACVLWAP